MNLDADNGWDQAARDPDGQDLDSLLTTPWFSHLLVEDHADEEGERVLAEQLVSLFVTREMDSCFRHDGILARPPGRLNVLFDA
jgi:hypothetical protein